MAKPLIHPNWDKAPAGITDGFSLEMTAKDIESLREHLPDWRFRLPEGGFVRTYADEGKSGLRLDGRYPDDAAVFLCIAGFALTSWLLTHWRSVFSLFAKG